MADLGAIGTQIVNFASVVGGTITGKVTDSNGSAAYNRTVVYTNRTTYDEKSSMLIQYTKSDINGIYTIAGLDDHFRGGPHKFAIWCFDDDSGIPAIIYDKVYPTYKG